MDIFVVTLASLFAGFVDAVVGGGGLILVPALFATFPNAVPATLLGTNKSASVWGSVFAGWQYSRRVEIHWRALLPAIALALVGSFFGAWLVTVISPEFLRKSLPVILLIIFAYTLAKKELGHHHTPRFQGRMEMWATCAVGLVLGFYDGFFGPGTGSFLVFIFVRWLGYDFLNASASAKLINVATNAAALVLFAAKGHVWWHLALPMAVANVVGSLLGTRLAMKHGAGFVRIMFIGVVGALILKTSYDAFLK
ncbi:MAG: TSUP family transporter [Burkholderiaceae bacterium]|nr:TSUP family transporter [Burkholderiaceae bacterium]